MRISLVLVVLLIHSSPSLAKDESSCSDAVASIQAVYSFVGNNNISYQLKRNGQTYAILAHSRQTSPDPKSSKWRLIERQGESVTYCVIAEGTSIEPLASVHSGNPPAKYGLPGSGSPRCFSQRVGALPGSVEVRLWANKELGESIVLSLNADTGNKNYTFLTSKDNTGYWILLETAKNNLNDTCYHSRGDASDIKVDYWPFKEKRPDSSKDSAP